MKSITVFAQCTGELSSITPISLLLNDDSFHISFNIHLRKSIKSKALRVEISSLLNTFPVVEMA